MNHPSHSKAGDAKLQYIDNLRGVAIIMVVITHADKYMEGLQRHVSVLVDYCQMGVQLFFIASAFTLCMSMDRRRSEEPLKTFYLRRYFRIAPLYYFGILFYFFYYSIIRPLGIGEPIAAADHYTFSNTLVNILLVNDFVPGVANNRIVPGGWSIGTETTFYAVFPFLFALYAKFRNRNILLTFLPFIGFVICFFVLFNMEVVALEIFNYDNFYFFKQNNSFLYFNIICQLPVFLLGMSLYFKMKSFRKATLLDKWLLAFAFLGFSFIGLCTYVYFDSQIYLLPLAPAISFFFLFILFKEVPFLSSKLLGRIGQLSFSIYLFHFVFAWEGSRYLPQLLNGVLDPNFILLINIVLSLALSIVVATFSEKYIEKPGMTLGNKIISFVKKEKGKMKYAVAE